VFSSIRWLKQTAMSPSAITALLRVIGSTEYSRTVINSGKLDSQYSAGKYISRHKQAADSDMGWHQSHT